MCIEERLACHYLESIPRSSLEPRVFIGMEKSKLTCRGSKDH